MIFVNQNYEEIQNFLMEKSCGRTALGRGGGFPMVINPNDCHSSRWIIYICHNIKRSIFKMFLFWNIDLYTYIQIICKITLLYFNFKFGGKIVNFMWRKLRSSKLFVWRMINMRYILDILLIFYYIYYIHYIL